MNIKSLMMSITMGLMLCLSSCDTLKPTPSHPNFVSNPKEMVGYGYVNKWIDLSEDEINKFADALVASGLNVTQVELLGFANKGFYRNTDEALNRFVKFADIMKSRKITILITMINWNAGGGGVEENGKDSICGSYFNDAWFYHMLDRIINEVGTEGIILEVASEWGPSGRNSQCWSKANSWHNGASGRWNGMKAWNKTSRPSSAPSGYFLDWHIDRMGQMGPRVSNKIVVTDTSNILNALGGLRYFDLEADIFNPNSRNYASNSERLAQLVKECKADGAGFIMYGFSPPSVDYNAITVIGNAWKGQ